jgi:hypothetical protein
MMMIIIIILVILPPLAVHPNPKYTSNPNPNDIPHSSYLPCMAAWRVWHMPGGGNIDFKDQNNTNINNHNKFRFRLGDTRRMLAHKKHRRRPALCVGS